LLGPHGAPKAQGAFGVEAGIGHQLKPEEIGLAFLLAGEGEQNAHLRAESKGRQ
jgi:hypothetical protein